MIRGPGKRNGRFIRHAALSLMLGASINAAGCVAVGSETAPSPEPTAPTLMTTQATTTTTRSVETPGTTDVGSPWWNDRVFYEIFARSCADSDGEGIDTSALPPAGTVDTSVVVGAESVEPYAGTLCRPVPTFDPFDAVVIRLVVQT